MIRQGCSYAELDISTDAKWKKLVPMEERGMAICGALHHVACEAACISQMERTVMLKVNSGEPHHLHHAEHCLILLKSHLGPSSLDTSCEL